MLQDLVSKSRETSRRDFLKILGAGALAFAATSIPGMNLYGFTGQGVSPQQFTEKQKKTIKDLNDMFLKRYGEDRMKVSYLYGKVAEGTPVGSQDLSFVIETGLTLESYMYDIKFGKLDDSQKKYLVLVERKFDPKFADELKAIKSDINKKPYRVQVFTDGHIDEQSIKRNVRGKYDMKVTLAGLFVYDKNPRVGSNEPDRHYDLGGVYGGVIGGVTGTIKK
jgi:hypothetical protein